MVDEEEKFYTWEEIEKELTQLEAQFGDNEEILQNLITPSVSSYWRKKLEEEKLLYEKMLQTKEEEKKQILLKLEQQQQIIDDLKQQIEKIEKGEHEKIRQKYEELKLKEIEIEKEKEKLIWQQQIQGLEFDKKIIEQEVEKAKRDFEQQKQELLVYYNRQFNSLLEIQNQLLEETAQLEKELDRIVAAARQEVSKVSLEKSNLEEELNNAKRMLDELAKEKQNLLFEKNEFIKKIEEIKKQNYLDKVNLLNIIAQNVKNYTNEVRSLCGLIIGAVNFIVKFSKYKNSVKFHYELILNSIQKILKILDDIAKFFTEFKIE